VLPSPEDEVHIRNVMKFPDRVPEEGEELGLPDPEPDDDDEPDDEPDDDGDGEDEPEPDEDEDEATNAMMREFAATRRPLTKGEKKAGLRRVQREQDVIEEEARIALVAGFRRLTDRAIKRLGTEVTPETIDRFKITITKDLRKAYGDLLNQSFRTGRLQIRDQMRKANFEVNYVPREAVQFLETTERFWVKSLGDELTQDVRQELVQAVRGGHHHRETIQRVRGVMAPFTGDPAQLGDPKQASAARVETIVRTNGTTALNHGRLVEARRVGAELVPAMQYSAVLDGNTTDVCRGLDGKVFPIDSPDLDRLSPPNHFRCRSILVPVTLDIEIDPKDMVTPADVGRAVDQAGKGFAGGAPPPPPAPAPVPPTPLPVKRKRRAPMPPEHMQIGPVKKGDATLERKPFTESDWVERTYPKSLSKMRSRYGDPTIENISGTSNYNATERTISMRGGASDTIMRHEWGHYIDHQMAPSGKHWWSEHNTVRVAMQSDSNAAIGKIGKGDALLNRYKKLPDADLEKKLSTYGPDVVEAGRVMTKDGRATLAAAMDSGDANLAIKASNRVPGKFRSLGASDDSKAAIQQLHLDEEGAFSDFVGSLTENKAGGGHSTEYLLRNNNGGKEMFANAVALHEMPIHRALISRLAPKWHKIFVEAIAQ
jgi:SPP1 gp7 family putative phage head morphogenesis protein